MNTREIELKMEAIGSLHQVSELVEQYLTTFNVIDDKIIGEGRDYLWTLNNQSGDFARLRQIDDSQSEFTVKAKDKGSNLNRMEKNITMLNSLDNCKSLLSDVIGQPTGTIYKSYFVYTCGDLIFCTYTVDGSSTRVFIEVEGSNEEDVIVEASNIKSFLKLQGMDVFMVNQSLYELFIKSKVYAII